MLVTETGLVDMFALVCITLVVIVTESVVALVEFSIGGGVLIVISVINELGILSCSSKSERLILDVVNGSIIDLETLKLPSSELRVPHVVISTTNGAYDRSALIIFSLVIFFLLVLLKYIVTLRKISDG
jgi:hypothetical protein